MYKNKIFPIIALFLAIFVFSSCRKEEKKINFSQVAKEHSIAQNLFDDVFKQVDKASKLQDDSCNGQKTGEGVFVNGCATITISSLDAVFPKTISVDFGAQNCMGNDGRNRRGILNYTITSWYRDSACKITVIPSNFYVNDYKVEGTKTIVNNGRNASGNLNYIIEVTNATITTPQNETFSWSTHRNHEWIEGENTILNPYDDVYLITGNATGITSEQTPYTITIDSPLNILVGCRWVRQGSLIIQIVDYPDFYVDYGSGECDANASVTVNGTSYPFIMN